MDAELIFAEDIEVCPKCGSSEFWENWIILVGDDPTDEELASIECKVYGAVFYARAITIGGALASLKMMKKYHFRKGEKRCYIVIPMFTS